jgi:hypothetical protein
LTPPALVSAQAWAVPAAIRSRPSKADNPATEGAGTSTSVATTPFAEAALASRAAPTITETIEEGIECPNMTVPPRLVHPA